MTKHIELDFDRFTVEVVEGKPRVEAEGIREYHATKQSAYDRLLTAMGAFATRTGTVGRIDGSEDELKEYARMVSDVLDVEETDMLPDHLIVAVPEWALCYLFNDDPSGLSDEDIEAVDKWVNSMIEDGYNASSLSPVDVEEEPRFTTRPAFGLPCDCVECVCEI